LFFLTVQLSFFILLLTLVALSEAKDNPCSGLWFGEIVANPEKCYQYYVCLLTRPVPVDCEPYKVFDISRKECVPGDPETCEIGEKTTVDQTTTTGTTPSTTTGTTPSTTTTTARPPPNLEDICQDTFFAAKPFPDSQEVYVGCIRGKGVLFSCLENEFFSPVINECLKWPELTSENPGTQTITIEISTFPESTSTQIPDTTTTRVVVTTSPTPLEDICEGKFFEYIKHPTNCALFIFCYDQKEFLRQCPEFTIFDIKTSS
jgi:hypothetical protein